tara:strand:- start:362 stop:1336 length:975 start_codon:yes stop_codon:yes gene_type:complete
MIKNVLITGGAGYIGSHIAEVLIKNKKKVYIVDDLSTGFKKLVNKKSKFYKENILNFKRIKKIIHKNKIDSIIHLAAALSVGESQKYPNKYNKINVLGTKKLLLSIKGSNVKNFIFSSTCAVYKDGLTKVSEQSNLSPKSVYGKTKLKGEKLINNFCKKNKINCAILRFFNVAGASPSGKIGQINKGDQLFKNLSIEIKKKRPVFKIYGTDYETKDGTCVRDYIHVVDISRIHNKVLEAINKKKKSIILNCGYNKGISVLQVVREFKKFTKKYVKIIFLPRRTGDMVQITSNTKKLNSFIKWTPKYNNLSKIVKSCLKWEKVKN